MRQGDPDSEVNFYRSLEDRIRRLESKAVEQNRQSVKELRIRAPKRLSSMMVIGDSISQFDRCDVFQVDSWVKENGSQYRWQDRVADALAGTSGLTRIAPIRIGPFIGTTLVGTPKLISEGDGPFVHWDYAIPGASAQWWLDTVKDKYAPAPQPVDLLCVMLGANDFFLGIDPEEFLWAIRTILFDYPHNYACVIVPWQNTLVTSPAYPWSDYVSGLHSLAGEKTVVVEPVSGLPDISLAYDGLHPSQDGHNLIAQRVISAVGSLDKAPVAKVSITASRMGAVVEGGIVIGNWRISVNENGDLVGTNMLTHQSTVLAS